MLIKCKFINNQSDKGYGGAMWNSFACTPRLDKCIFINNAALRDGGGMENWNNASPTLSNCIFLGNSAGRDGGGMKNHNSYNFKIYNCTFSNNVAARGGGIMNIYSAPILINCILWANRDNGGMDESAQMDTVSGGNVIIVNYCCIQGWTGLKDSDEYQYEKPPPHAFHTERCTRSVKNKIGAVLKEVPAKPPRRNASAALGHRIHK